MKCIITILVLLSLAVFILPGEAQASSSFENYINNPIISYGTTAYILYENNIFTMWFSNGNNLEIISRSSSVDGINWTEPVPVLLPSGEEIAVQAARIIHDGSLYKMWYQSTGLTNNYFISYATSPDGVNWTKYGAVNLQNQSGEIGSHVAPYVLKVGSEYKMWYTVNDAHWKISFATSIDGINWIPYAGNPVIYPTEPWEQTNTVAPSVIFDGTTYKMYYHDDGNISYAFSPDGINWTKPLNNNPVLTGGVYGPFAFVFNSGTIGIYYNYLNSDNTWRIGLATDGPVVLNSPTPMPSPTATPTPTIIPSPTPTLPPPPVTKVIVIPGFGGSINEDAIVHCKLDSYSGTWKSWQPSDQAYKRLLDQISKAGYTPLSFYYDWRKQPSTLASSLKDYINQHTVGDEKVNVVAHSMGGLVARAYIEQEKSQSKIAKLMTVGTPHKGVVFTYPIWEAGELINSIDNIQWKTALLLEILACRANGEKGSDRQIIQHVMPSIQTFLPVFNFLVDKKTKEFKPIETMSAKNPWLLGDQLFFPPYYGVKVGTLSGGGVSTLKSIRVKNPSMQDFIAGNWIDGKPEHYNYDNQGDGLVLKISSQLPQAENRIVAGTHGEIVSSRTAIEEIISFLTGTILNLQPFNELQAIEPKNVVGILSTDTPFETNTEGKKITTNLTVLSDPDNGDYALNFTSNPTGSLIVIQIANDDTIRTNTYNLNTKNKKKFNVKINKQKPLDNPLSE